MRGHEAKDDKESVQISEDEAVSRKIDYLASMVRVCGKRSCVDACMCVCECVRACVSTRVCLCACVHVCVCLCVCVRARARVVCVGMEVAFVHVCIMRVIRKTWHFIAGYAPYAMQ